MDLTTGLVTACLSIGGIILILFLSKRPASIPVIFFFCSALYLFLDIIPLPTFKGSGLRYVDIVCLILFLATTQHYGLKRLTQPASLPKLSLALWLFFIPPLIIGFAHDYNPFTVLRDGRMILYYGMVFPLYLIFTDNPGGLERGVRGAYYFTILAVAVYFIMMFLNIQLYKGRHTYTYSGSVIYTWWGLHSWVYLYMFGIFYLFPRLILRLEKRLFWASAIFVVFNAVLLGMLIRAMFVGWAAGMTYLIIMLSQRFKRRSLVWSTSALALLACMLVINIPVEEMRNVTVIARYGSMINPDLNYRSAQGTAKIRLESLQQFEKNEGFYYLFGEGYGDPRLAFVQKRDSLRVERMVHSAWGWLLSHMGVVGTGLFVLIIMALILRRTKTTAINETLVTEFSLRAFLLGMVMAGFGTNVLFYENFAIILVVLAVALIEALHTINRRQVAWILPGDGETGPPELPEPTATKRENPA